MDAETTRFDVTFEGGASPVLDLTGEVDPAASPTVDVGVEQVLGEGATEMVIDRAGLSFVESSGLRSFIRVRTRLEPVPLRLRRPTDFAMQLRSITGRDQQFQIDTE